MNVIRANAEDDPHGRRAHSLAFVRARRAEAAGVHFWLAIVFNRRGIKEVRTRAADETTAA